MKINGMDANMEERIVLNLIKQIQCNQPWRSTWKAELNGKPCIAKLIDCQEPGICQRLSESLDKQINFSETLAPEDEKSICLFHEKVEINENQIAFCRDYVNGKALDEFLKEHDFSLSEAVELVGKISAIIAKANSVYKVSHGDLKPANIIVGPGNEPVIIDWDTMKLDASVIDLASKAKTVTLDQSFAGTPKYMPPEQCRGERIDEQCDVYALGIILYQLINHGKTPFDEPPYSNMNTMQLMAAKEQPISSLSAKHPELKVNDDLSNIIDKAVAPDCNVRYENSARFLEDLNNLILSPVSMEENFIYEERGSENTDSEVRREKSDQKAMNFVLVGHPQSGKTVLAAGLYATSCEDFTVEAIDLDTQNQAINTKSIIEKAEWPAKTSVGTIKNLNFRLFIRGREAVIRFDEYAGELISSVNYFRDVLKQPDGVLILLNTGAPQLHDPLQRNKMLEQFNNCITYLCDLSNPPPIAFVVTASDRLSTDLKDWKSDFEQYAGRVISSLQNHKCKWKRFNVSVCGHLEKQDVPKLEPHNTHKPFVWLMKEFDNRKKIGVAKTLGLVAILIGLLTLLTAAGRWIYETRVTRNLINNVENIENEFRQKNSKDDLLDFLSKLLEERNRHCAKKHISSENRLGSRLSDCDASCATVNFWYDGRKNKFDDEIVELEKLIDQTKVNYFSILLGEALKTANDVNYKAVKSEFVEWRPLRDIEQKDPEIFGKLAYRIKYELEPAHERYVFEKLKEELQGFKGDTNAEQFPKSLDKRVEQWIQGGSILSSDERRKEEQEITDLQIMGHQICERHLTERLLRELQNIIVGDDIVFPSELEERVAQWSNHISDLSPKEKIKYENDLNNLVEKAKMAVYTNKVNELRGRIVSFIGSDDDLAKLISEYNSFLDDSPGISDSAVKKFHFDLSDSLLKCLEKFVDDLCSSFREKQMNSKSELKPDFIQNMNMKIYPIVSDSIRKRIRERIDASTKRIYEEWDEHEKKIITDFIDKYIKYDVDTLLKEFAMLCNREVSNKHLSEAEVRVHKILTSEIEAKYSKIEKREVSPSFFSDLKTLCSAIRNKCKDSPRIRKDKIYTWVCDYLKWVDENPSFNAQIDDLSIKVNYQNPDDPYIGKLELKKFAGNIHSEEHLILEESSWGFDTTRFSDKEFKKFQSDNGLYSTKIECKLGECIYLKAYIYDENGLDPDTEQGNVKCLIYTGLDEDLKHRNLETSTTRVSGRIDINIEGQSFDSWLKKNPFPQRQ